jgi:hypothetical protein
MITKGNKEESLHGEASQKRAAALCMQKNLAATETAAAAAVDGVYFSFNFLVHGKG